MNKMTIQERVLTRELIELKGEYSELLAKYEELAEEHIEALESRNDWAKKTTEANREVNRLLKENLMLRKELKSIIEG